MGAARIFTFAKFAATFGSGLSTTSQRRSPVIDTTCMARSSVTLLRILRQVLIVAMITTCSPASVITVTPPVDDEAVLHNPDMGWVAYENYPVDPNPGGSSNLVTIPNENFDGVDHVAIMFSWADVEKEPGKYDF